MERDLKVSRCRRSTGPVHVEPADGSCSAFSASLYQPLGRLESRQEESMRIVVVGATGTIGRAVVEALSARHEIIPVSHSKG
jgi:hypothetical protein